MKQYHITFEVPDDFNPEELELNASYKDELSILDEGFVDVRELLKDKSNIEEIKAKSGNVLLYKFPQYVMENSPESILAIKEIFETAFPDCTVIGLIDSIDVLVQNSAEAIDMLQKMINTINLRSSIKIAK